MATTGVGNIAALQRVCSRVSAACDSVPLHVRELAQLPQNSHRERDLHRWVSRQVWRNLLPDLYEFMVPATLDGIEQCERLHSCLLPHEVFAQLYNYPELFERVFGSCDQLEQFWAGDQTFAQQHPVTEVLSDPRHCVPIGIYGDDSGIFTHQKVLCLFWGSVATAGLLSLDSRIIFTLCQYAWVLGIHTFHEIYKVWTWSLTWLAMGLFPDVDHNGMPFTDSYHPKRFVYRLRPLAGRFRGVFSDMRGDWKWQVEALELAQSYAANYICHFCKAHKRIRRLFYTQCSRDAYIRRTLVTWAQFRDWLSALDEISPLFKIPGFNIWRVWTDAMHCLDLGVYQEINASCLYELTDSGTWPGPTRQTRLDHAHVDYKAWCRTNNHEPCPRFDAEALRKPGESPSFTQHQAKANQTKYLLCWLLSVLRRPGVTDDSAHDGWRMLVFEKWVRFEDVCNSCGRYLTHEAVVEVAECAEVALVCQNALCEHALRTNNIMWQILPKNHMATHMAYDMAKHVNPRRVHNYPDEDMVGKVKNWYRRATASQPHDLVCNGM